MYTKPRRVELIKNPKSFPGMARMLYAQLLPYVSDAVPIDDIDYNTGNIHDRYAKHEDRIITGGCLFSHGSDKNVSTLSNNVPFAVQCESPTCTRSGDHGKETSYQITWVALAVAGRLDAQTLK